MQLFRNLIVLLNVICHKYIHLAKLWPSTVKGFHTHRRLYRQGLSSGHSMFFTFEVCSCDKNRTRCSVNQPPSHRLSASMVPYGKLVTLTAQNENMLYLAGDGSNLPFS